MEQGIEFDHAVGASAGAAFGAASNPARSAAPYATTSGSAPTLDTRASTTSFERAICTAWTSPTARSRCRLDPFDTDAMAANPMRFTAVCTDIVTGEPVYRDIERGDEEDLDWIRASASVPMLANPVELDGHVMLDGGIADSIPVSLMMAQGYGRNVAVLTQPAGFRKGPNKLMPLLRKTLSDYPRLIELLADRHERYNAQLDEVARLEGEGRLFVIRPSESVKAPLAVKDPEVLERIYQVGRRDAEARIDALRSYLEA